MHNRLIGQRFLSLRLIQFEPSIRFTVTCAMLLLTSVVLNVLLARKLVSLQGSIEVIKSEGRLQVGTKVPALEGQSVDGLKQTLNYADVAVPTVLYVFTPQCVWCAKNIEIFGHSRQIPALHIA